MLEEHRLFTQPVSLEQSERSRRKAAKRSV